MKRLFFGAAAILLLAGALADTSRAQTIFSEDFTGAQTTNQWYFTNGACLTAGTSTSVAQPGPVVSCSTDWGAYYSQRNPSQVAAGNAADTKLVGGSAGTATGGVTTQALDPLLPTPSGALRFTNGSTCTSPGSGCVNGYDERGAIVSANTFNASQGVQITFKTVTYRGSGSGTGTASGYDGADGIGFFLINGALSPTAPTYNGTGSVGGSLGYTCSNTNAPYDGLIGAYLGLGIDEFGNFLNGATLEPGYTSSGGTNTVSGTFGDNTSLGYGYKANRIGLRGAGNVSWNYLSTTYPTYYPTSTLNTTQLQQTAVQNTCINGAVLNYQPSAYSNCPVGGVNNITTTTNTTTTPNSGSFSAKITSKSSTTLTGISATGLVVGQTITQTNHTGTQFLQTNTTIAVINSSTSITLSAAPKTTSGTTTVTFSTAGNTTTTTTTTNDSNTSCPVTVPNATLTAAGLPALQDYAPIVGTSQNSYVELPSTVQLANETAMARPTGLTTSGVTNGNVFLYNLKITQDGFLSLSYSVNGGSFTPVITKQSISATNGTLPGTLRFGFSGSTGGSTNIHELLCFKAAPVDTSSSSSTTNQQQTGKLETTSQAYFAYYNPSDWTGRMAAYGLAIGTGGTVTINSMANWDGQCNLTGVANLPNATCPTTGLSTPSGAQSPTSAQSPTTGGSGRAMLTWNGTDTAADPGSAGVPFEWPASGSGITTTDEAILDAGDTAPINANRLNYLRGVRTNEIGQTGGANLFRARDGVLSDIVDSSPVWVGPPSSPYALAFMDRLVSTDPTPETATGAQSYATFQSTNQPRLNVVYVGANDGFLHGFETGTEDTLGNIVSGSANDGLEVLAYMPGPILASIHNATNSAVDFANTGYSHNFFVDATPGTGDLFYGGAWHTWLVGGLGAGGSGIYALDITNPTATATAFSEANAAALVKGDWSSATITCSGVSNCGNHLGNTYGTPLIRRFHNGTWGAIFGNGYGSTSGDAGIFVMTVNQTTGAETFYYLSAGASTGSASNPNGIAYVTAVDLDGDHITDYVYAGDLQGNLWRFDLTSCAPVLPATTPCAATTAWGVTPGPLFKTQTGQPITTPVVVASGLVVGAAPSVIVSFGTGQRTYLTVASSTTYASGTQSLYGVWDWNFSTWNALSPTQYASLTAAQMAVANPALTSPFTMSVTNLQAQSFTAGATAGTIDSSNNTVTWAQCTTAPVACTAGKFGWYANLAASSTTAGFEQIVSSPSLFQQALLVNSTVPATNAPLACTTNSDTGNTYVISVLSGGTFTTGGTTGSTGSTNKTSGFLNNNDVNMVGLATNENGALSVVTTQAGTTYLMGQSISPVPGQAPGVLTPISLPTNIQVNRVTWTQLR